MTSPQPGIIWTLKSGSGPQPSKSRILSNQIRALSLSYESPNVGAAVGGEGIRLFDFNLIKDGKPSDKFETYIKNFHFSGKRKHVLSAVAWGPLGSNLIAIGTVNGDIFVYDIRKPFNKLPVYAHNDANSKTSRRKIYSLLWGPFPSESKNFARAIYCIASCRKIEVHVVDEKRVTFFEEIADNRGSKAGKTEMAWRDDSCYAAVGFEDGQIEIYHNDLANSKKLKLHAVLGIYTKLINCIKWHPINVTFPDGSQMQSKYNCWLAACSEDETISLVNLNEHLGDNELKIIEKPTLVLNGHNSRVTALSWSTFNEGLLASVSCEEMEARVWNVSLENPTCTSLYTGHWGNVYSVSWSLTEPDLIYTGGADGTLQIWKPSENHASGGGHKVEVMTEDLSRLCSATSVKQKLTTTTVLEANGQEDPMTIAVNALIAKYKSKAVYHLIIEAEKDEARREKEAALKKLAANDVSNDSSIVREEVDCDNEKQNSCSELSFAENGIDKVAALEHCSAKELL